MNPNPDELTPRDKAGLQLRKAFSRLSPQGSNEWNFSGVFNQLDKSYGHHTDSDHKGGSPNTIDQDQGSHLESSSDNLPPNTDQAASSENGHRDLLQRAIGRWLVPRLLSWVDDRANRAANGSMDILVTGPISSINSRLDEHHLGLTSTTDAFRFLSARVQELESQTNAPTRLLDYLPSLTPSVVAGSLTPIIIKYLRDSRRDLVEQSFESNNRSGQASALSKKTQVLHGECANAELVTTLTNHEIPSYGVEPRANLAIQAVERGIPVTFGQVPWYVSTLAESTLGGLILSGFIERIELSEICNVLKLATTKLAPGAPLVLFGVGPNNNTASKNSFVSTDLSPGKPLNLETWKVLFREFGFSDITSAHTDEVASKDERSTGLVPKPGSSLAPEEDFQQANFLVMGRCQK